MHRFSTRSGGWRGVFMTLAVLALVLKIMVPQGFMVADRGAPFPLVICTGHGPMQVLPQGHDPSKTPEKKSDAPCAFAGSVTPPTPSLVATIAEPYSQPALQIAAIRSNYIAPGLGLAAPPPFTTGPPSII